MGSTQTSRRRHRLRTLRASWNPSRISGQETTRTCRPWARRRDTIQTKDRHRLNGHRLASVIVIAVLSIGTPVQAKDHNSIYGGIMKDDYYLALARCETGNNINHSTKSYTGMYGIHRQTFARWSNYNSAKGLTPRQQTKVADAIAFLGHTQRDGKHIHKVGPFGWGAVRNGCGKMLQMLCASKHPKVTQYAPRACRLANG